MFHARRNGFGQTGRRGFGIGWLACCRWVLRRPKFGGAKPERSPRGRQRRANIGFPLPGAGLNFKHALTYNNPWARSVSDKRPEIGVLVLGTFVPLAAFPGVTGAAAGLDWMK